MQDQLLLWEEETRRVVSEPAMHYCKFEDEDLFWASFNTAQGHGSVLWRKTDGALEERFFIIKRSGEWGEGDRG